MRVMDNSPIDVPAVGRLVKEQYAVGQFADCCLYALPSNTGTMVEKAKEVFDGWIKSMGAEKLLNKYDFEGLGKMPVLDNHPMLSSEKPLRTRSANSCCHYTLRAKKRNNICF